MDEAEINALTHRIIGAAMEVHKNTGPGLLESLYEKCLCQELSLLGIPFKNQVPLLYSYKGLDLDCNYRLDFVIDEVAVVEIKSVEKLLPIHEAQLMTYLKLSGLKVGLLINFNEILLKNGIKRRLMGSLKP